MTSPTDEGGTLKDDARGHAQLIITALLLFIGLQFSLLILHAQWPPKVGQLIVLGILGLKFAA